MAKCACAWNDDADDDYDDFSIMLLFCCSFDSQDDAHANDTMYLSVQTHPRMLHKNRVPRVSYGSRAIFWCWLNAHYDYDDDNNDRMCRFEVVYFPLETPTDHRVKWNQPHFYFKSIKISSCGFHRIFLFCFIFISLLVLKLSCWWCARRHNRERYDGKNSRAHSLKRPNIII